VVFGVRAVVLGVVAVVLGVVAVALGVLFVALRVGVIAEKKLASGLNTGVYRTATARHSSRTASASRLPNRLRYSAYGLRCSPLARWARRS